MENIKSNKLINTRWLQNYFMLQIETGDFWMVLNILQHLLHDSLSHNIYILMNCKLMVCSGVYVSVSK